MNDVCETITIKGKDGPIRVNKTDYDADQSENGKGLMKLDDTAKIKQPVEPDLKIPVAPSAPNFNSPATALVHPATALVHPAPNQMYVAKIDKKFFVTNSLGETVQVDGIDEKGYKNEADAWQAITDAASNGTQ